MMQALVTGLVNMGFEQNLFWQPGFSEAYMSTATDRAREKEL